MPFIIPGEKGQEGLKTHSIIIMIKDGRRVRGLLFKAIAFLSLLSVRHESSHSNDMINRSWSLQGWQRSFFESRQFIRVFIFNNYDLRGISIERDLEVTCLLSVSDLYSVSWCVPWCVLNESLNPFDFALRWENERTLALKGKNVEVDNKKSLSFHFFTQSCIDYQGKIQHPVSL